MNEVAKKQDTDVGALLDAFDGCPLGFEGMDKDCISMPFLKIAQSSSDEVKPGTPEYMENLKMGSFFIPSTRKVFGTKMSLIILKFYRAYSVYDGEGTDSKFKGVMTPEEFAKIEGECTRVKSYMLHSSGYRYVDTRNFIVINAMAPEDGYLIFSMSSTGISPSKKWLTMAQDLKVPNAEGRMTRVPIWAGVWELETSMQKMNENTFYQVSRVAHAGMVPRDMIAEVRAAFLEVQAISAETVHAAAMEKSAPDQESMVQNTFGPKPAQKWEDTHPKASKDESGEQLY